MVNYNKFEIFYRYDKIADVEIQGKEVKVKQYIDNHFRQSNKPENITQIDLCLASWKNYKEEYLTDLDVTLLALMSNKLNVIKPLLESTSEVNLWSKSYETTFKAVKLIADIMLGIASTKGNTIATSISSDPLA